MGEVVIHGLKTCDTCRKARRALEGAGRAVRVVDVREAGLDAAFLDRILAAFGEKAVNRASTTWRGLGEEERAEDPRVLLARHPALMKRPVVEDGEVLTLGWGPEARAAHGL